MMPEYIFLMHGDTVATEASWGRICTNCRRVARLPVAAIGDGEIREMPRTDE